MSENLQKIIKLDKSLDDYLENGIDTTDLECEKIVLEINQLLKKLSNDELIYLLLYGDNIHQVADVTMYFKKYKINKKRLKQTNEYQAEFKKLKIFLERLEEASINEDEYMYLSFLCKIDETAEYLLNYMKNEEIMELANQSDNWDYKLFLFSYLKE